MAKPFWRPTWRIEDLDISVGDETEAVPFAVSAANNHGDMQYAPVDDRSPAWLEFGMAACYLRKNQNLQVTSSIISM
jgi:hypothetical protein